jgi:hypothetical protein
MYQKNTRPSRPTDRDFARPEPKRARELVITERDIQENRLHTDEWEEWFQHAPFMIGDQPLWRYAQLAGNLNVYTFDLFRRCAAFTDDVEQYPLFAHCIQFGYGPAVTRDGRPLLGIPFDPRLYNMDLYAMAMLFADHT